MSCYASLSDNARRLADRLRQAYEVAEQALDAKAQERAARHDKKDKSKRVREFDHGDRVWLFSKVSKKGLARKLKLPWNEPYRITKVIGDTVYAIKPTDGSTTREMLVHVSRLKAYTDRRLIYPPMPSGTELCDDLQSAVDPRDLPELPAMRGTLFYQAVTTYAYRPLTSEERALRGRAFRDTNDNHVYRVTRVDYNREHQVVVAYYERLREQRNGDYVPGNPHTSFFSTADEVQEWIDHQPVAQASSGGGGGCEQWQDQEATQASN